MKPQQRIFLLRNFILPKILHLTVLSRIRVGTLIKTDRMIRSFLRKHLNLPHDALNAFFHSDINDGGLGIISFRLAIPEMRRRRLEAIKKSFSSAAAGGFINDILHLHLQRTVGVSLPGSPDNYWKAQLARGIDGAGLAESNKTPGQHSWVRGGNLFMSGRDFINCIKLRFNCLPCRSRCSRGRSDDRRCRAGCSRNEDLAHILQSCPRTHGQRIRRHDALTSYTIRGLEQRGFHVTREPHFKTSQGLMKPDILAVKDGAAYVIDAQVVTDGEPLRKAHSRKLDKYAILREPITLLHGTTDVFFHSLTVNWRGVWSSDSCKMLIDSGLIRKKDIPVISTRAIIGGIAAFNFFNKSTQRSWTGPRRRR